MGGRGGVVVGWDIYPWTFQKNEKNQKKTKKIKKILNIFELLKAFVLKGLRVLESYQKLQNKKYLQKMLDQNHEYVVLYR